ncbi:MAG: carboxypeptidase-like regulatory domain-containing protein, partial [Bacteroidota bacterium]
MPRQTILQTAFSALVALCAAGVSTSGLAAQADGAVGVETAPIVDAGRESAGIDAGQTAMPDAGLPPPGPDGAATAVSGPPAPPGLAPDPAPAPGAAAAPPEPGADRQTGVRGRIGDRKTGEALAGAPVTARGEDGRTRITQTDPRGAFQIWLPPGRYTLRSHFNFHHGARMERVPVVRGAFAKVTLLLDPIDIAEEV